MCQALYVNDFLPPVQSFQEAGIFVVPIFQEGNWDFESLGKRPKVTKTRSRSSDCWDRFPRLLRTASLEVGCACNLGIFFLEMETIRLVFPTDRVVKSLGRYRCGKMWACETMCKCLLFYGWEVRNPRDQLPHEPLFIAWALVICRIVWGDGDLCEGVVVIFQLLMDDVWRQAEAREQERDPRQQGQHMSQGEERRLDVAVSILRSVTFHLAS